MRIGFLDTADYDYTIETVYQRLLGGSSSARYVTWLRS